LGGGRRAGLLDFDFDDTQVARADILADVHAARGVPRDIACLPMKVLGWGVRVGDVLIGGYPDRSSHG